MSELRIPSDEEIEGALFATGARGVLDFNPIRALIRAAVEKAVAEERARFDRENASECARHDAIIDRIEIAHARELERSKLEAKMEALYALPLIEGPVGWWRLRMERMVEILEQLRAALAALDQEEKVAP